jgi:hypothetical protein
MHAGSNPWGDILGQFLGLYMMRPELRRVRQEREATAARTAEEQTRADEQQERLRVALETLLQGLQGAAPAQPAIPQPAAPPTLSNYPLGGRPAPDLGALAGAMAPLAAPAPAPVGPAPTPAASPQGFDIGSPEFVQAVMRVAAAGGDVSGLIATAGLMPEPPAPPIEVPGKLAQEALGQHTVTAEQARLLPSLLSSGILTKDRPEPPEPTPLDELTGTIAAVNAALQQRYPGQADLNIGTATSEQLASALYLVTGRGREAAEIPTIGPQAAAELAQTAARTTNIQAQTTHLRADTTRINHDLSEARNPAGMTDKAIQDELNVLADNEAALVRGVTSLTAPVLNTRGQAVTAPTTSERQALIDRANATLRRIDQRRSELEDITRRNLAGRHGM